MKKIFFASLILVTIIAIWMIIIPGTWRDQLNSVGYAFCHRIPSHSNHIHENAFSFCARCYGMYFGALIGFIYLFIISKNRAELPKWYTYIPIAIFFLIFAMDGLNSMISTFFKKSFFYETTNLTRQITGLGIGMSMSIFLSYALNASVWVKEKSDTTPIINSFKELIFLLFSISAGFAIFFIPNIYLQEFLNIASVFGFILTLSSIILVTITIIFKKENSFETIQSLIPYIIISVSIAIFIILSFDLARFWLTDTWQGFNI